MLVLKRMQYFNEYIFDTTNGEMIAPGDYYYEEVNYDKTTGEIIPPGLNDKPLIISAKHYWELKKERMEQTFDNTYYNRMESEKEYREALKEAEMRYNESRVLSLLKPEDIP